ncbi:MAG TPA: MarR family transcriptional regulator [Planctomycetota bacterium]|jgi:DNA-binding MarR family transcriptional regulator|nr:MarR family transcriptional regulator [Planctomycetota bacterium]
MRVPKHSRQVARIELLFRSVLSRFTSIAARAPAAGKATFAQVRVLWALDLQGPSTLTGLAARLGTSCSAATEIVDRLVRAGYVDRLRASNDRRRVVLSLRPRGRRLMSALARQRRLRFRKLLGVLEPREVARLERALASVQEILGRWQGG